MVLFGASNLSRAFGGCKGPIGGTKYIEKLNIWTVKSVFFNLCKACQAKTMAAIPPCTFTAGRIRETQRDQDMKLAKNTSKLNDFTKFFETNFSELSPLKYNSKLMNSIWGLYNRYSPHNVKKINEASVFNGELQSSAAKPNNKPDPVITLPPASLDNVWAGINVSQSH